MNMDCVDIYRYFLKPLTLDAKIELMKADRQIRDAEIIAKYSSPEKAAKMKNNMRMMILNDPNINERAFEKTFAPCGLPDGFTVNMKNLFGHKKFNETKKRLIDEECKKLGL